MKTISGVEKGDILYRIHRRVHDVCKVTVTKVYDTFDGKIHIKVEDNREMCVNKSDTHTYIIGLLIFMRLLKLKNANHLN